MATNHDFSRSSFLQEQYQQDMDLITTALQDESPDEQEDRLSLVSRSWSLTSACFHSQLETNESSESFAYASVAVAHL